MHWFWRAAIAILFGTTLGTPIGIFLYNRPLYWLLSALPDTGELAAMAVPAQVLSLVAYRFLTNRFPPVVDDLKNETRCRKCGYILRGLTEPRCPECGERI